MLSLQVPQQLLQSKVIYTVPRCCHCSWCWWRRRRRGRWWWWWWQQVHNPLALASCSSSWLSWVCGVLVSCRCLLPWGELRAARSRAACQGYGKPLLRALELHLQHACHQNKQSSKEASQQHSTPTGNVAENTNTSMAIKQTGMGYNQHPRTRRWSWVSLRNIVSNFISIIHI